MRISAKQRNEVYKRLAGMLAGCGLESICLRQWDAPCMDVEGWTRDVNGKGWCVVVTEDVQDGKTLVYAAAILTDEGGEEFDERSWNRGTLHELSIPIGILVHQWHTQGTVPESN